MVRKIVGMSSEGTVSYDEDKFIIGKDGEEVNIDDLLTDLEGEVSELALPGKKIKFALSFEIEI